ncbi:hypothetical protein MLD38_006229 [Melastoma candidum]|uniref:Uncharacterized protein n=1 Tax=Melastoma candidum TaxID=119954 RepID=A0ACB9RLV6_9MYRT|nr:hypothetical protein MLD38_006229 [Melastoma candidum]
MLHKSFKPAKCKTSLKLAASRIKLLKNKKGVQIKQLRREVAQLLESSQVQTARIRVEHVVREEKTMGAYELIEIYCELIAARLPIIESQKNCPIDLKEAIASVVFASPRCADIPELMDVRKHFLAKYGKDFISAAVELRPDCGVNRSLVEKLSAKTPDGATKLKMLTMIAEEHNINWDPNSMGGNDGPSQDDLLKGPSTFEKASRMHEEPPNVCTASSFDVGSRKAGNDEDLRNSNASTSFGFQNVPRSPEHVSSPPNTHLQASSANVAEGSEARHGRYSGDASVNYVGRPDWNMEFADATAAAQAAAESAERASMAARAAAHLSSRGRDTAHYSPDPHGFIDERLQRPYGLHPPGEDLSRIQLNNASVGRKPGTPDDQIDRREENLARDRNGQNDPRTSASYKFKPDDPHRFKDERLQRPSGLLPPGEDLSRTQLNNAPVGRNPGMPDNQIDQREENLARDRNGQNDPRTSASSKYKPDVGSTNHGGPVRGGVAADNTVGSRTPDTYLSQGDDSDDNDSLSGVTKKLYQDAYKKSSNSNSPDFGTASGDMDALFYKQQSTSKSTETNPWSTDLDGDGISQKRSARKDSFEEVNIISSSSKIHARKSSDESFVEYTPDMQENSSESPTLHSTFFMEKDRFSSLDDRKADNDSAENPFANDDEERISTYNKASGEGSVVFDDYESDGEAEAVFDLDKGPKPSHTSSLPHIEAHQLEDAAIMSPRRIMAESFKMNIDEAVPEARAAPETEENLPVTFDDSDGLSSENEPELEKPRVVTRETEHGTGVKKSSSSSEFVPVVDAEIISDSGSGFALGNLTGGCRNKNHVPPPYTQTTSGEDSFLNRRRHDHGSSSSSSLPSTDKVSYKDPDIHDAGYQLEGRPTRRTQTSDVSHEVAVPQPKAASLPVVYADDDEEFELEANYWKKPSTRPTANDSSEKKRLSSRNTRQSNSDVRNDIAEEQSSGKSGGRTAAGLSRRTKVGSTSRDSGAGENPVNLKARENASNVSESRSQLKWRNKAQDKPVSEPPAKPSGKEVVTESSRTARHGLDSASREDSLTQARHVHPKMPQDYESLISNLQSLRAKRQ